MPPHWLPKTLIISTCMTGNMPGWNGGSGGRMWGGGTPGGAGSGGGGTVTAGCVGGGGGGRGGGMGKPGCGGGGGGRGGNPGGGSGGMDGAITAELLTEEFTTMVLAHSALVMGAGLVSSSEISMSSPEEC